MNAAEAFARGFQRAVQNDPPIHELGHPEDAEASREHNADYGTGVEAGVLFRAWAAAGKPWPAFADTPALELLRRVVERWRCEYHCCSNSQFGPSGHSPGCPLDDAEKFLASRE